MIYQKQKIDNFFQAFDKYPIIVLVGENYKLLQKDAKKISDIIAGTKAEDEMRVVRYFNQEISSRRDEIISSLKIKSFFPGPKIIMLNGLSPKDYKIILDIEAEWQKHDAITIVTINELSKNYELKKLLGSSSLIALVNYSENKMNSDFLEKKLVEKKLNYEGKEVLEILNEFANFTSEDILDNELEKLKLFKFYDDKPVTVEDFFKVVSVNYEIKELNLAAALAERNVVELEKNLSVFFSQGKSPISILNFVSAYFYKLTLIKLYGPNSYEAKREYPFLIANDLEKAKLNIKLWSLGQLSRVANSLSLSDLKLRKYPSLFQRSILTQSLHKIMEI